jgi:hypothetical protein
MAVTLLTQQSRLHHTYQDIVTCPLKPRIMESEEPAVASERLSKHVFLATDMRTTIQELLEAVFSVRSTPAMYQGLTLRVSSEQEVSASL